MKIPNSIYRELYDYLENLLSEIYDIDDEGKAKVFFEFCSEDDKFSCCGTAIGYYRYEDDSFSHEFGIETCWHYELDTFDIEEIDDDWKMYFYDDTNDFECKIDFDYDEFYHCEDDYTIKCKGTMITENDDVIVRNFLGKWTRAKFKSYNPLENKYFVECDTDKYLKYAYRLVPYTDEFIKIIGTYNNVN